MIESQFKLYELLLKFDAQCQKYGIEYYLSGGTTLGALRHRGFLPWDDDVDVQMTRNNYNKLLACKDSFFDEDFIFVDNHDFPKYANTITRCVETQTTAFTKARLFDDTPKGEYIEIFLLDPLPDEPEVRREWITKHWIYIELLTYAFKIANPGVDYCVDEKLYRQYLKRYNTEGRSAVLNELENELFTIDESAVHDYCFRWGLVNRTYPIEWFGKARRVPFEDVELPVPAAAERVMRVDYGDTWANIPKMDDQRVHPVIKNPNVGYRSYVEDYSRYVDNKNGLSFWIARKNAVLDVYFAERSTRMKRLRTKGAHVRAVASRLDKNANSEAEYEESFMNAYSLWHDNQFSDDFWQWQVCVDVQDDGLSVFLEYLLETEGFSPVKTILLWRGREHTLSEQLSEINFFVCALAEIYSLIDCKEYEAALELYKRLAATDKYLKYCDLYDMRYLSVLLKISCKDNQAISEDLLREAQALVNDFPESGDAVFLLGKTESLLGYKDASWQHLAQAKTMTSNAFFLHEIDNILPRTEDGQDYE